jgi:hypothetical protein
VKPLARYDLPIAPTGKETGMQVDTTQLRKAAAQLRRDVIEQLEKAGRVGGDTGVAASSPYTGSTIDGAFDTYTGAAPYSEAAHAWLDEIGVALQATTELADALERAAEDYDRSDVTAAHRLTVPR